MIAEPNAEHIEISRSYQSAARHTLNTDRSPGSSAYAALQRVTRRIGSIESDGKPLQTGAPPDAIDGGDRAQPHELLVVL